MRLHQLGVETFIVLADYQVITDRDALGHVEDSAYSAVLDYLAAGIGPLRANDFHSLVGAVAPLGPTLMAVHP